MSSSFISLFYHFFCYVYYFLLLSSNELLNNPSANAVIPHLEGARKIRIALDGRGKSGGARVIYVDIVVKETIYLLLAYPKNQQKNLTPEQERILSALIRQLKEE